MRAIATTIRDRSQKWWGQYEASCARLDEAMRAMETALGEKWQVLQAWRARLYEQARHQPPCYSLLWVQRAMVVAKWLVGMSGAGTVLAFTFYIQSYLSISSIKDDCVSLHFVADANGGAVWLARRFLVSGMLALLAIVLPTAVGIGRTFLRWMKAYKLPPLPPGHEFDGWSEYQVRRIRDLQWLIVVFSFLIFLGVTLSLLFSGIAGNPEGVRARWHKFELQCAPPQPPD
jgi:hypothetical protein